MKRVALNEEQLNSEGIPIIPEAQRRKIHAYIREKFKNLVFRRVAKVSAYKENYCGAQYWSTERGKPFYNIIDIRDPSVNSNEENIQLLYENFIVYTSPQAIRSNDPFPDKQFIAKSAGFSQLDITNAFNFSFRKPETPNKCPPKSGDVLCGIVVPPIKGKFPLMEKWFICSEQFLRLWTLICYDNHNCFKYKRSDPEFREWLMSGNILSTNPYLKWLLGRRMNHLPISQEEDERRFVLLRTEFESKKWVHVYNAIALMVIYGELPCLDNVPQSEGFAKMTGWSLHREFVRKFLQPFSFFDPKIYFSDKVVSLTAWNLICDFSRSDVPNLLEYRKVFSFKEKEYPGITEEIKPIEIQEELHTQEGLWVKVAKQPVVVTEVKVKKESESETEKECVWVNNLDHVDWGDLAEEEDGEDGEDYDSDF